MRDYFRRHKEVASDARLLGGEASDDGLFSWTVKGEDKPNTLAVSSSAFKTFGDEWSSRKWDEIIISAKSLTCAQRAAQGECWSSTTEPEEQHPVSGASSVVFTNCTILPGGHRGIVLTFLAAITASR